MFRTYLKRPSIFKIIRKSSSSAYSKPKSISLPLVGLSALALYYFYPSSPIRLDAKSEDRSVTSKRQTSRIKAGQDSRSDHAIQIEYTSEEEKSTSKSDDYSLSADPSDDKPTNDVPDVHSVGKEINDDRRLNQEDQEDEAYNELTGEINWDCPCLGGMAHGPCGEQFKEAFSCFVYSKTEPKGSECIEKFRAMQDCFREHPDVYSDQFDDDDEVPNGEVNEQQVPNTDSVPGKVTSKEEHSNDTKSKQVPERRKS